MLLSPSPPVKPPAPVSTGNVAVEMPGEFAAGYGLGWLEGYRTFLLMAAFRPGAKESPK
jgi:hypothetical protein